MKWHVNVLYTQLKKRKMIINMIRNRPDETRPVDLHVHSNRSDGSETPSALVDMALEKGLAAFALTDHDTTDGLADALAYAADKDIEVIPGIEFSTE